MQRAPAIAAQLRRQGLKCAVFSQAQAMEPGTQVLIYDRMGYLFPIMSIADIVFMGGTYDPKIGGHNLYEPAAMGKTILGGPYYNNFPDIGRELEESGVYHRVKDSEELLEFLKNFPGSDNKAIGDKALNAIAKRKGSLACSLRANSALSRLSRPVLNLASLVFKGISFLNIETQGTGTKKNFRTCSSFRWTTCHSAAPGKRRWSWPSAGPWKSREPASPSSAAATAPRYEKKGTLVQAAHTAGKWATNRCC